MTPPSHTSPPLSHGADTSGSSRPASSSAPPPSPSPAQPETAVALRNVSVAFANNTALRNISLDIPQHQITAFIGPSGCGKSTLLRCINRLNDLIDGFKFQGAVFLHGQNIYAPSQDVVDLRKRVGLVFQKSNAFAKSIFDNVAYGLRVAGIHDRATLNAIVESSLKSAALWDDVSDRLHTPALSLSLGQQQRLCIARAIAIEPEILLLDEPASALDPIATAKIEELILQLKQRFTIAIVTHNMQQAARISDFTAFLNQGELVEYAETSLLFTTPSKKQTEDYVTGRFG